MKKINKRLRESFSFVLLLSISSFFGACEKDHSVSSHTFDDPVAERVSKPQISVTACATTYDTFEIVFKVVSDEEPYGCTIFYGESAKKTDSPNLNKSSSCRLYKHDSNTKTYYYKSQHAGFHEGWYLYYYGETSNSAGEAKTQIKWDVFPKIAQTH
jgi:hypothetical protein